MAAFRLETKAVSGRGNYPLPSGSHGSFAFWAGTSAWPSVWRLASHILSTRLLDLAAIDMKLVAVS